MPHVRTIPVRSRATRAPLDSAAWMMESAELTPLRIALVACRDAETAAIYRRALLPRRFVVEPAASGADALAKALSLRPDIVIADTLLPLIDGYTLRELLRSDPDTRHIPVVLVTQDDATIESSAIQNDRFTTVVTRTRLHQALGELATALCATRTAGPMPPGAAAVSAAHGVVLQDVDGGQASPPSLRCMKCDAVLVHDRTYLGGVPKHLERWDVYWCPAGCGTFEYRHRTRTVRSVRVDRPATSVPKHTDAG
jgi:CheY-like chemotaxis protein